MRIQIRTHQSLFLFILILLNLVFALAPGPGTIMAAPVAPAENEISILMPLPNEIASKNLRVEAFVDSTFELKSVVAQVASITTTMVISQITTWPFYNGMGFVGLLSLQSLPRGTYSLTVSATDVFNNVFQKAINVIYDRKPVIDIAAPLDFTVVRSQLALNVSCTDDDPAGCRQLDLKIGRIMGTNNECATTGIDPIYSTSSQANISETVTLTSTEPTLYVCVTATDEHQSVSTIRTIFVERTLALAAEDQVSGTILDVNDNAILFRQTQDGIDWLKIKARATGVETTILSDTTEFQQPGGHLTPNGVLFTQQSSPTSTFELYEWRDGTIIDLGVISLNYDLQVAGRYAIWNANADLDVRDLVSGTTASVAQNVYAHFINANGDILYTQGILPPVELIHYRAGVTTTIASGAGIGAFSYARTDGQNVAYYRADPSQPGYSIHAKSIISPTSQEITLSQTSLTEICGYVVCGRDFRLNNGWIAFTRYGNLGVKQVWLRAPNGEERQISFFGSPSNVDSLGPQGEVVLSSNGHLYFASPGTPLVDIGLERGTSYWIDGKLFRTLGRSLFRVVPDSILLPLVLSNAQ